LNIKKEKIKIKNRKIRQKKKIKQTRTMLMGGFKPENQIEIIKSQEEMDIEEDKKIRDEMQELIEHKEREDKNKKRKIRQKKLNKLELC